MAVRTRARARRSLITRTAREWSRLTKQLLKDASTVLDKWLAKVVRVDTASGFPDIPDIPVRFERLLVQYMLNGMSLGRYLTRKYLQEIRPKKKMQLSEWEWDVVLPEDAINWIKGYVPTLAEVLQQDVLKAVRDILLEAMRQGLTIPERAEALKAAGPDLQRMTQTRLKTIARTELTRADTMGRLVEYKESDDVEGVEFSAILDDRTTEYCEKRHGLVMRLDDPRLARNTPPLHPNCRSLLLAVTIYEHKGKLKTSAEFEDVPDGIQRDIDIETVERVLT